jgi:hypothetical protein
LLQGSLENACFINFVIFVFPSGKYLSSCDEEQRGGGHYRESQEEDGFGSPCHSEDGHNREDCTQQQRTQQVSAT